MPKQNNNNIESTIEINSKENANTISPPAPKVLIKTFIVVNAIALSMTPMAKQTKYCIGSKNAIIEQQGKSEEVISHPVLTLKYEDGKMVSKTLETNKFTVQPNNSVLKNTVEIKFQQIVGSLREENAVLKNRLKNSLPVHTIVYLLANCVIATSSLTLLFIRFVLNIYIVDPYYLICMLIISVGLFSTACVSLKDWKDNLLNEEYD